MTPFERLYTKVFENIDKTLYITAQWRLNTKRYGFWVGKDRKNIYIGLLFIEIVFFDWGKETK